MTKLHLAVACSAFALTYACADPTPLPPQPSSPPEAKSEESPKPAAPNPPPPETAPPPTPEPKPTGVVSVHQTTLDQGNSYRSGVYAQFGPNVGAPKDSCTTTQDGPCAVTICPTLTNDKKTPPSAGRVWFNLPGRVLELTQLDDGTYAEAPYEERLFTTNDKLTASADGKEFPAFSLDVVAPPDVAPIAPALGSILDKMIIDRKKPYTVTWHPAKSGDDPVIVTVTIITTKDQSSATLHVCEGKLEDGSLTIPQTAVAAIGQTGEKASGMIVMGTSRRKSAKVGSEVIRFEVSLANHVGIFDAMD